MIESFVNCMPMLKGDVKIGIVFDGSMLCY